MTTENLLKKMLHAIPLRHPRKLIQYWKTANFLMTPKKETRSVIKILLIMQIKIWKIKIIIELFLLPSAKQK